MSCASFVLPLVSAVRRKFGEFNKIEAGKDEEYYRFEDLLTKDYGAGKVPVNVFNAKVTDSLPLFVRQPGGENIWVLNRKAGDIFTREIEFPTIPGKKIRVRLEVVDINKAGQPQYRELGF